MLACFMCNRFISSFARFYMPHVNVVHVIAENHVWMCGECDAHMPVVVKNTLTPSIRADSIYQLELSLTWLCYLQ
jgi:hypothetical protein